MRIAFATTTSDVLKDEDADRPIHDAAFAEAGIELSHCVWWDSAIPWDSFDLVVIRSPWDYVERLDEFVDWLRRLDAAGNLRNPAPLVEWNLDKRYLLDLDAAGVPVIPTEVATDEAGLEQALARVGGEIVVKPVVSAGSRNTGRFSVADPGALVLGQRILGEGQSVLIQPAVPSVATEGEVSAVVFNGSFSHSFRKGPILSLGGGLVGDRYVEDIRHETLSHGQHEVVDRVLDALASVAGARFVGDLPLLYARVDMVTLDDGREVVLELELAEPSFFLPTDPDGAHRFVAAVRDHVGRRADS